MQGSLRASLGILLFTLAAAAQKHELGLTLGTMLSQDRGTGANVLNLSSGTALQVNYSRRLMPGNRFVALYGDTHFLASPQRVVATSVRTAIRDVASLYVVPGIKVKFAPQAKVTPWFSIGYGYALYEHSLLLLSGLPAPVSRHLNRGALGYGGGIDWKVWRNIAFRLEARDLYSGAASFNVPSTGNGQSNIVAGGGIVFRFQ